MNDIIEPVEEHKYLPVVIYSAYNQSKAITPMTHQRIPESLRQGRLSHQLSQTELAKKLGMRQSQVSDLERGAVDPRLSTVQDVARLLDWELMLVPRQLVSIVDGLLRAKDGSAENRPVYALQEDEEGEAPPDRAPEVGGEGG